MYNAKRAGAFLNLLREFFYALYFKNTPAP